MYNKKFINTLIIALSALPALSLAQDQTLSGYIDDIYNFSLGIGAILAVLMVTVGAIYYTMAGAAPDKKKDAKDYITSALFGLVLLLGAAVLLGTVNPEIPALNEPGITDRGFPAAPPLSGDGGGAGGGGGDGDGGLLDACETSVDCGSHGEDNLICSSGQCKLDIGGNCTSGGGPNNNLCANNNCELDICPIEGGGTNCEYTCQSRTSSNTGNLFEPCNTDGSCNESTLVCSDSPDGDGNACLKKSSQMCTTNLECASQDCRDTDFGQRCR